MTTILVPVIDQHIKLNIQASNQLKNKSALARRKERIMLTTHL
jgi:hypothetical protein